MKQKTITQKVLIPAEPEEVYDALIDAKKHSAFTGSKASCEPKVGGRFTAWDGYISGKNLKLERGRGIVQEWKTTEWPEDYPPLHREIFLQRERRRNRTDHGAFKSSRGASRGV